MSEHYYWKLVRDRIPEIILKEGKAPNTIRMTCAEYKQELLRKITEEVKEIKKAARNKREMMKEIGDAQEVIEAIIKAFGLNGKEIREIKRRRKKERGGFEKRIFLISVE
jgi:predicted house-cleaning noncanonical NTP pyrophosphatase (MazG superfamily)